MKTLPFEKKFKTCVTNRDLNGPVYMEHEKETLKC
jgi:hypothetical protein